MSDSHQPNIVGHWISVKERMPDDDITCLVWSEFIGEATMAAHDGDVLDRHGDSGWICADGSRRLLGVTHWCADVRDPFARRSCPMSGEPCGCVEINPMCEITADAWAMAAESVGRNDRSDPPNADGDSSAVAD